MAQVALAWLLQKPGITSPIIGATKPEQLTDAIAARRSAKGEEVSALKPFTSPTLWWGRAPGPGWEG